MRLHKVAEPKPPWASGLSPESSESRDAETVRQERTLRGEERGEDCKVEDKVPGDVCETSQGG